MSAGYFSLDHSDLEWIARRCGKARRVNVNKWVCLCPAHDDHTPSLSVSLGHEGQILFYCHAGCRYDSVMDSIGSDIRSLIKNKQNGNYRPFVRNMYKKNNLKYPLGSSDTTISDNSDKSDNNGGIRGNFALKNMIKDAKPIINTPVEAYLNNRLNGGFPHIAAILSPGPLQYLPCHWHAESRKSWPVMLASTLNGDGLIGLHRTFLDGKGNKAPVSPSKKILGKLTGGYTPFGIPQKALVLAEGIETALSLYVMFQTPVWATLSSTNMASVRLPPLPLAEVVYIAQDNDEAGRKAARDTADGLWREGRRVVLVNPPPHLNDFNDYLKTGEPYEQYRRHFYGIPARADAYGHANHP